MCTVSGVVTTPQIPLFTTSNPNQIVPSVTDLPLSLELIQQCAELCIGPSHLSKNVALTCCTKLYFQNTWVTIKNGDATDPRDFPYVCLPRCFPSDCVASPQPPPFLRTLPPYRAALNEYTNKTPQSRFAALNMPLQESVLCSVRS